VDSPFTWTPPDPAERIISVTSVGGDNWIMVGELYAYQAWLEDGRLKVSMLAPVVRRH
jgi:hypothetical protein